MRDRSDRQIRSEKILLLFRDHLARSAVHLLSLLASQWSYFQPPVTVTSEKHIYYYDVQSDFIIVEGIMMICDPRGVLDNNIK